MDGEIEWQFRAEHAEKACAEMRGAIEDVINFKCDDYYHDYCSCSSTRQEHLQRALSSDCGSGYVRREELEAAKAEVERLRELVDYVDRHIVDPVLVQGDCDCAFGSCGELLILCPVCAAKHFREADALKAKQALAGKEDK